MPSTPQHPIHSAIDDIWNQGHTPRIQVDSRRDDVVVPDSVRTKWGARLVLDLDASWPLNFEVSDAGIEVDLAFQGVVTRCTLPWAAIYVVLDRTTGRGIVIESHLPRGDDPLASTQDETDTKRRVIKVADAGVEAPQPTSPNAELGRGNASRADSGSTDSSETDASSGEASSAHSSSGEASALSSSGHASSAHASSAGYASSAHSSAHSSSESSADGSGTESAEGGDRDNPGEAAATKVTDEEAKRRRARFKVIDGGG